MISQQGENGHKNVENTNTVRGFLRQQSTHLGFRFDARFDERFGKRFSERFDGRFGGRPTVLSLVLLGVIFFGGIVTPQANYIYSQKWVRFYGCSLGDTAHDFLWLTGVFAYDALLHFALHHCLWYYLSLDTIRWHNCENRCMNYIRWLTMF